MRDKGLGCGRFAAALDAVVLPLVFAWWLLRHGPGAKEATASCHTGARRNSASKVA